jgi:tetraprenyl-beta-curcumene synthase
VRQLLVLVSAVVRELLWGLPAVAREVRVWRLKAMAIPDAPIREDALGALARKRAHTDGAALFWIIPRARNLTLLRMLAAFEIMCDFLDSANEHGAQMGQANGRQLHLALIDALAPEQPLADYYLLHPWRADGGYLCALVEVCRECCRLLPSYEGVRRLVVQEALRGQVLAINHDLDPRRRDLDLRAWAAGELAIGREVTWFELTGAASAPLTIHALLALGAEPSSSEVDILGAHGAYLPWISAATTMLDSYVDQIEDVANGDHSYVAHYSSHEVAVQRICRLVRHSLCQAGTLRRPERHVLIVACMVAMYLSKDSARSSSLCVGTGRVVAAGGSLTAMLVPILRLWRTAYTQRSN